MAPVRVVAPVIEVKKPNFLLTDIFTEVEVASGGIIDN